MDKKTDPRIRDGDYIRKILYIVYVKWPTKLKFESLEEPHTFKPMNEKNMIHYTHYQI
jgi:hypothetical protein